MSEGLSSSPSRYRSRSPLSPSRTRYATETQSPVGYRYRSPSSSGELLSKRRLGTTTASRSLSPSLKRTTGLGLRRQSTMERSSLSPRREEGFRSPRRLPVQPSFFPTEEETPITSFTRARETEFENLPPNPTFRSGESSFYKLGQGRVSPKRTESQGLSMSKTRFGEQRRASGQPLEYSNLRSRTGIVSGSKSLSTSRPASSDKTMFTNGYFNLRKPLFE